VPPLDSLFAIDLGEVLTPDPSLIETFLRGSIMYVALFLMLRLILRRQPGTITLSDLLVLVLVADAAQNAMANEYRSITNGLVLVATIIGWNVALDWLGYHSPVVKRFIHPPRKPLVRDGRLIRPNLAEELMTEDELMTQLRLQGVERLEDVKAVYVEGNGQISVIKTDGAASDTGSSSRRSGAPGS
jgi:uncharacterized membrane protein YcaP (DUF421 family)